VSLVLTFASIHDALKAEKALRSLAGRGGKPAGELVPLPPAIKSDCGFGLLLEAVEGGGACYIEALRESGVEVEASYRIVDREAGNGIRKERSYERIV
jgi:Protein of unknown function (DUF3343)